MNVQSNSSTEPSELLLLLQKQITALQAEVQQLRHVVESDQRENAVSIVCFSGEWDRLFATFTIANGALALGQEVNIFFTFWGATAVRKSMQPGNNKRSWMQKLLGKMLPSGVADAPLSKMNFCGLGRRMVNRLMKEKGLEDLGYLMDQARELGANFHYCDASMTMFGWSKEELIDGPDSNYCGVSTFLATALKAKIVLFI